MYSERYCKATKEGGRECYYSNRYDLAYNRRCLLDTLKGLISCFQSQKTGFSVHGPQKGPSALTGLTLPKICTHGLFRALLYCTAHVKPPAASASALTGVADA
jgi:hypothetical protein